jgi:hypothetical protein
MALREGGLTTTKRQAPPIRACLGSGNRSGDPSGEITSLTGAALVDAPVGPASPEHPLEAGGRDAALPLHLVHADRGGAPPPPPPPRPPASRTRRRRRPPRRPAPAGTSSPSDALTHRRSSAGEMRPSASLSNAAAQCHCSKTTTRPLSSTHCSLARSIGDG